MNINKLLISTILIAIGLSFMPLIGQLVVNASTRPDTETIYILVPESQSQVNLTDSQYQALLSAYNGEAISLDFDFGGNTYPIVTDYELVDPNWDWRIDQGYYELAEVVLTDEWFIRFDNQQLLEFTNLQDFPYLDGTLSPNQEETQYVIVLAIEVETEVASFSGLITIFAVLITTSAVLVYLKFR